MENCLVKTLKGSSSNPNLKKFNIISFSVTPSRVSSQTETVRNNKCRFSLIPLSGKTVTVRTVDGSNRLTTNSDRTGLTNSIVVPYVSESFYTYIYYPIDAPEFEIEIVGKYNLKSFRIESGSSEASNPINLDIDNLSYSGLNTLLINYAKDFKGNIENLKDSPITSVELVGADCDGDITSIANLTGLTKLDLYGNSNIYGSLNDFVSKMIENLGTLTQAKVINCRFANTGVTVNGGAPGSSAQNLTINTDGTATWGDTPILL